MSMEQAIITWIHLVSAAVWVGGTLFIGAVLAPLLKKMSMSLEERIQMMVLVGRRFNKIAVPSLIILIATGIYNSQQVIINPDSLLSTSYGSFLLVKIILVIALIIAFIVHVRIIRKDVEQKIISKEMTEKQIQKLRKKIIILGEIIVVLSVAVLFFAALLDAGV
ncbi:MAG: CopD family protein [Thaumarchaeota archaeon]|nr:CopD family protein [Nitrososphaerota archaeon]MCH8323855.1 CopD family protein [Nitrososphaerota archaeon]GFN41437.1 MAG: CopD domain-containing protein [Marine Group I thaumarchaeote]